MTTLHIFFAEWWPTFVGISLSFSVIWIAGRFAAPCYFLFTTPKAFRELATFAEDEQKRLLQEASRKAFRSWRSVMPVFLFALVLSTSLAVGRTIPKVANLPDTLLVHMFFSGLLAALGGWFAARLAVSCVRPFLRTLIETTNHVA
jgi:hypothetical protein